MRRRLYATLSAAALLVGCAQTPDEIAPSYVSSQAYLGWSCDHLVHERDSLREAVAEASARQTKVASADALGVLLIGLPSASMSGEDLAPQLAKMKGQQRAVDEAMRANSCLGRPAS